MKSKKYGNQFVDKTCIVTGGAIGIGQAIAVELGIDCGANVIVADLNTLGAQKTADQIISAGGQATAFGGDLSDEETIRRLITTTIGVYGRLDYVSSNVAATSPFMTLPDREFETMDIDWVRKTFDINFMGSFLLLKHSLPELLKQEKSSYVIMSSVAARFGDYQAIYACTKAALEQLVRAAASMYGKRGFRINAVEPSTTLTPALLSTIPPAMLDILRGGIFNPDFAEPDKIATVVSFLLSDDAYTITGLSVCADNGYHACSGMSALARIADRLIAADDLKAPGEDVYRKFEENP